jgi:hypothetical protein
MSTYNLVPWSADLDLTDFYNRATNKGFTNNNSQRALVDCFNNEKEAQVWILYHDKQAVGSVAAHTLDIIPNAVRICARTCVFTDQLPLKQLRGLTRTIKQHQNITAQFFIPKCIEWANGRDMYITSHASDVGTQRLVHNIYCPALVETGALTRAVDLMYRGHMQTFWRLNTSVFLEQLNENPRF